MAMIVFDLINPHSHSFKTEFEANIEDMLKTKYEKKVLPTFLERFKQQHARVWRPLKVLYDRLAVHSVNKRPDMTAVVPSLVLEHVNVTFMQTSQSQLGRHQRRRRANTTNEDRTQNACTFLSLMIGDKVLQLLRNREKVADEELAKMCTDVIRTFPKAVNVAVAPTPCMA